MNKGSLGQKTNYIDARNREQTTLSKIIEKFWKVEDSAISNASTPVPFSVKK